MERYSLTAITARKILHPVKICLTLEKPYNCNHSNKAFFVWWRFESARKKQQWRETLELSWLHRNFCIQWRFESAWKNPHYWVNLRLTHACTVERHLDSQWRKHRACIVKRKFTHSVERITSTASIAKQLLHPVMIWKCINEPTLKRNPSTAMTATELLRPVKNWKCMKIQWDIHYPTHHQHQPK